MASVHAPSARRAMLRFTSLLIDESGLRRCLGVYPVRQELLNRSECIIGPQSGIPLIIFVLIAVSEAEFNDERLVLLVCISIPDDQGALGFPLWLPLKFKRRSRDYDFPSNKTPHNFDRLVHCHG